MNLPDFSSIVSAAEKALDAGLSGTTDSGAVADKADNENHGVKKDFFRHRKISLKAKEGPTERKVRKHSFRRLFEIALKSRARLRVEKLAIKRKGRKMSQATVYPSLYSESFGQGGSLSSPNKRYSSHLNALEKVYVPPLEGLKKKSTFSTKSKQICDTLNKNLYRLKYLFSVLKKSGSLTEDSVKGVLRDFLHKNGVIPTLQISHLSNYVKINNGDKKYLYISDIAEYLHQHLTEEIRFSPVEVHEDVEISYSNIKSDRLHGEPVIAEDGTDEAGWVHANDNYESIPLPSGVFPEKSYVASGDGLQTRKESGDLGDELMRENEDLINLVAGLKAEQPRIEDEKGPVAQDGSDGDVDIEQDLLSRGEFMEQLSDAQREDRQKEMYTTFIKRLEEAKDKDDEFKKIMDEVNMFFVFHQIDADFFVTITNDLRKRATDLSEEKEKRKEELKKKNQEMPWIEKSMLEDLNNHPPNQGELADVDLGEFHLGYMDEISENNKKRRIASREKYTEQNPTSDNGELPVSVPREYPVEEGIGVTTNRSEISPPESVSSNDSEKQEKVILKLDDFLSKYEKFSLLKNAVNVSETFFENFFKEVVVSDVKSFPCDTLELSGTLYDVSVPKDMDDLANRIYRRYSIERLKRLNRPKRKK